eukprot:351107_1
MRNTTQFLSLLWFVCYSTNILRGDNDYITCEPVATQLVYTTNDNGKIKYNLNKDAVDLISTISNNEPFDIISTIGQARNGKSFTLNNIIQQITGTSINTFESPFKTNDTMDSCTDGIWMFLLPKCSSDGSYVDINKEGESKQYLCTSHKRPYLFLDIEGADTETEDQALRYATIVTLLSQQTFLFLHRKLYKHDFDHIYHIQSVISKMNAENIDFNIADINLGVLIREPGRITDNLQNKINADLRKYFTTNELNKFESVHEIPNFHTNKQEFYASIRKITEHISIEKHAKMKWLNGKHIQILLKDIIHQLNNNKDLSAMCMSCPFPKIIEWLPFTYSECSKACGTGTKTGIRNCNSNRIEDCKKYIGGTEKEIIECNTAKCKWIPNGYWTECSKKCGNGTMHRYLKCSSGNDDDCDGQNYETKDCNTHKCEWKPIGPWTACSKKCAGGTSIRYLQCSSGDDKDCDGVNHKSKPCNERNCEWILVGAWTPWQIIHQDGWVVTKNRKRYRYCESGDNNECEGSEYIEETKQCFARDSYVITYPNYEKKMIDDVKVYDKILSYDEITKEYVFSDVILLAHYTNSDGGNKNTKMYNIILESNYSITLTGNHLLYVNEDLMPASKIKIGDTVHAFDYEGDKLLHVIDISYRISQGRGVFTKNGNVVVNGVVASSYTGTGSFDHHVQHYLVKTIYNILSIFSPSIITDYNMVTWIRNSIYYGGLKFLLQSINTYGIIVIAVLIYFLMSKLTQMFIMKC